MIVKFLPNEYLAMRADELLAELPPQEQYEVDIVRIATEILGLTLHSADLQGEFGVGTLGMILPAEKAILWDVSLEPRGKNKQNLERILRYTLAHEVAHYCEHQPYMNADRQEFFYRNLGSAEQKRLEIQADIMAANILMPESLFRHAYTELVSSGVINGYALVSDLADLFNVSKDSTRWRLVNLSLPF